MKTKKNSIRKASYNSLRGEKTQHDKLVFFTERINFSTN